jgi:hypothetical protein
VLTYWDEGLVGHGGGKSVKCRQLNSSRDGMDDFTPHPRLSVGPAVIPGLKDTAFDKAAFIK